MKKFIIAAVAASLISTPVLAAPYQGGSHDRSRVEQNHRAPVAKKAEVRRDTRQAQQHRSWNKGERFDSRQAHNYRVINNPKSHRLNDAPRGYRWVQSGNDAVLVGITSGIVAAVMANMIR